MTLDAAVAVFTVAILSLADGHDAVSAVVKRLLPWLHSANISQHDHRGMMSMTCMQCTRDLLIKSVAMIWLDCYECLLLIDARKEILSPVAALTA